MARGVRGRGVGQAARGRCPQWQAGSSGETGGRAFRSGTVPTALNHFTAPEFWFHYRQLPPEIRDLADKNFQLLKADPRHSSLRLKKVGIFWSARIGLSYRALAKDRKEGLVWFWIG